MSKRFTEEDIHEIIHSQNDRFERVNMPDFVGLLLANFDEKDSDKIAIVCYLLAELEDANKRIDELHGAFNVHAELVADTVEKLDKSVA